MLFRQAIKWHRFSRLCPSIFSFTQSTEEKRRNSVDWYERLIKRQKTKSIQQKCLSKITLPQEIHSKSLYNTIKKTTNYLLFIQVCQTIPIFFGFILEPFVCSKLASKEEHLLLVLMKLKQGFLNADLAFRFSILHSDVSRIYNSWIVEWSNVLKFLIIWPVGLIIKTPTPSNIWLQ